MSSSFPTAPRLIPAAIAKSSNYKSACPEQFRAGG
ncbi:hypothetical protein CLOBOL_03214 [Enterocloster bolteae ATCC BAA-613]|uniref:Uncharacterized protein n=1 Tax=Enterocloster bolteae (strain ATCC BAA-613 / DSM 15670 / CCUG 46953 / JCM 12243 / WAL 16351) TaxID=411902 RepID=A8RS65_ENTBW|nr:hypothetical protein CLOBOL_03214 [Enterocloster bolteae ATCC BAA-613]